MTSVMDHALKSDFADTISAMSSLSNNMAQIDLPTDPDAQATVTDFLDFTEYLPADMTRSLTLIGDLDNIYRTSSHNIDDLGRVYGEMPNQMGEMLASKAAYVRAVMSDYLRGTTGARTLSHAEALRVADNVDRHLNRAKNILSKLQTIADTYPESRNSSPVVLPNNNTINSTPAAITTRGPKITLRLDNSSTRPEAHLRRKHRAPRITVPGEVLAPYEFDYESDVLESDDWESEEEPVNKPTTPAQSLTGGRIKLKTAKLPKSKAPKEPKPPRLPGQGTNVHSSVAGISTSNALAQLQPPPENAVIGSEDAPWLRLTDWELAMLRKRMKKNAVWTPSDTMIARELKARGRGIEAYRSAKTAADAAGRPFDPVPPQLIGQTDSAEGAISVSALASDEIQLSNRGMRLNEAKKLKKENEAKELAKAAAMATEESGKKLFEAAHVMKNLFTNDKEGVSPSKQAGSNKRKRESTPDDKEHEVGDKADTVKPGSKKNKTEIPGKKQSAQDKSAKESHIGSESPLSATMTVNTEVTTAGENNDKMSIQAPLLKTSSSTILPPGKEVKKLETVANTRASRRSSTKGLTPPTDAMPHHQEDLSREKKEKEKAREKEKEKEGATRPEPSIPDKSEPVERSVAADRGRRASTARNTPARTTPAPEPRENGTRSKKKPVPGRVTTPSGGAAAVSVGKRSAAPRKKAGTKKDKNREGSAPQDEVDDEGNIIDPNEPRYCLCNDVSWGMMIFCEGACEKEWFHLPCVNLASGTIGRTTKWYCPDCRVKYNVGEKGEITARGRRK